MEVHAHSHTEQKRLKHYLFEFFMLFLAVFCGFLAENFREHQVEKVKERQYIRSLIEDVKLDIGSLKLSSAVRKRYINYYDSLVYLLKQNDKNTLNDIYYYARFLGRMDEFKYHDRTIQQLKSSGGLRLIRKKIAADSITVYDNEVVKEILNQQERENKVRLDIYNNIGGIFNAYVWNDMTDSLAAITRYSGNPPLLAAGAKELNEFIIKVIYIKTSYRLTVKSIEKAITVGENLIALLSREYHLD
jgi:hypothetical protein